MFGVGIFVFSDQAEEDSAERAVKKLAKNGDKLVFRIAHALRIRIDLAECTIAHGSIQEVVLLLTNWVVVPDNIVGLHGAVRVDLDNWGQTG